MRISGKSTDVDYWRLKSKAVPIVFLDGRRVEQVVEARDGDWGFVRVELLGPDGKPFLANVVAPDGEVLDQVVATRLLRGLITIVLPELVG